jgi:hypothetical protein
MADWTSEDWAGTMLAARAGRHELPRGIGPFLGRLLILHPRLVGTAAAALLALVVGGPLIARWSGPSPSPRDTSPALEAPAWSTILKPSPAFVLDTPLFPREQAGLSARRHNPGGGREDVFSFGRAGAPHGFARVVVYRTGSEAGQPGTLFLELARRAAEDGFALLRSAQPAPLQTKFGPVESTEMVLSGGGAEHHCSAWRIVAEEQDLRVTGWLCSPDERPVDRLALACLVDRLELSPAQTDGGLRTLFSQTERRRTPGCPSGKPAPAIRRPA